MSHLKLIIFINIILIGCGIFTIIIGIDSYLRPVVWIEWSTASEMNTAGFNIYRSVGSENKYFMINQNIIPGSQDPLKGGNYQFKDRGVKSGKSYLYKLEEIENNGTKKELATLEVYVHKEGFLELLLGIIILCISVGIIHRMKKTHG